MAIPQVHPMNRLNKCLDLKKLRADREGSDDTTGGNAPLRSMAVDSPNGTAEEWFNGLVYIVGKIMENLEEILRN